MSGGRQMSQDTSDEHPYRVRQSTLVTPVIRALELTPTDTVVTYAPGQYVLCNDAELRLPPRSYSVANAPRPDGSISLLVTRVPGGETSTWVHDRLRVGEPVLLTGPYGTFVPDPDRSGPVLLLAAGSGLAPLRALAQSLLVARPRRAVTLFVSARTGADSIDHAHFQELARAQPSFRYLRTLTRVPVAPERPHIPDRLGDAFASLGGWEVFTAGPPGFVTACARAAQAQGADPAAVHTEEFFVEPQPWVGRPPVLVEPGRR
ncbi:MAG: FAD-binding oxidoreductase [Mycobacteriaceae bacterium]